MSSFAYQKEVLLREVYEYVPAWTYLLLACVLIFASELAFAVPVVAFTLATLFIARAVVLFARGNRIKRYQKNLTRLPMYLMDAKDLPISHQVHFLGMGFEWTAMHTQRIYDLNLPQNRKYKAYPYLYRKARHLELALEHHRYFQWLIRFTASSKPSDHLLYRLNPVKPAPPLQGQPYIHAVGLFEKEQPLLQELDERGSHMIVLGTTGVGKTRAAEIIIASDIRRAKHRHNLQYLCFAGIARIRNYCYCHLGHYLVWYYQFHRCSVFHLTLLVCIWVLEQCRK